MSAHQELFRTIVESNLRELSAFRLVCSHETPDRLKWYLLLLEKYLSHNIPALKELCRTIPDGATYVSYLRPIAELRLGIRTQNIDLDLARRASAFALQHPTDPRNRGESEMWRAELLFVTGLAFAETTEVASSRDCYFAAAQAFETAGLRRKAAKALLNFVVAESKLDPTRKFIVDYSLVAERAQDDGEFGVASVAQYNISLEYEIVGALEAAFAACERAYELARHDLGLVHHSKICLQRAHLLFLLGRTHDFRAAFEEAMSSNSVEIGATLDCLKVLTGLATDQQTSQWEALLDPPWVDKLTRFRSDPKLADTSGAPTTARLTRLENELLKLLESGPKEKFEILEHLYGNKIETFAAENRFRVLLFRLRRKIPGLIYWEGDKIGVSQRQLIAKRWGTV